MSKATNTVWGDHVCELMRQARSDVFVASPFIKVMALRRVLSAIPTTVRSITVVTRWIPLEIAAGVTDLEVFDVLKDHPQARLLLHPLLHAKVYRADSQCLTGSANLTAKGLGWAAVNNVEVLVSMPADSGCGSCETELLRSATAADMAMYRAMRDAIHAIEPTAKEQMMALQRDTEVLSEQSSGPWLPTCATPDRLWNVYSGKDTWSILESAMAAGELDLKQLAVPAGLSSDAFDTYVRGCLLHNPIVRAIEERSVVGLTDEQGVALVVNARAAESMPYSADQMWEVLKAWLAVFFPNDFIRTPHSEMIRRARSI